VLILPVVQGQLPTVIPEEDVADKDANSAPEVAPIFPNKLMAPEPALSVKASAPLIIS
jgi:hypothetical protein